MTGEKSTAPNQFKKVIGDLNPLFEGFHAADAKDLVFFIIETLHKENNIKDSTINIKKDFNQLENEAKDEVLMLQNFKNDFDLKNKSIMSDTFYGVTRSIMKCNGCNLKKFSFQTFNL